MVDDGGTRTMQSVGATVGGSSWSPGSGSVRRSILPTMPDSTFSDTYLSHYLHGLPLVSTGPAICATSIHMSAEDRPHCACVV